ncbi:MAG: EamA family transporter RarD [Acinetobacter populi]|uniref:EamA family transporter RarD n=1 Tax=Acinetobacter populi TaxID=1582270 RepID=UPI0023531958|nr:EamA family transporter RarD [Acinetobacter populi]MCH4248626.1 EamA family transporter RarD [Acinetobacter populi]
MLKGILFSVIASATFGLLYFYTQFLAVFNSEQTFGWRIVATLPFVTLLMYLLGDLVQIKQIYQRIVQKPSFLLMLILCAALCGFQLWLFLWGPIHDRGLQVSLGYFLLPLILVLCGWLLYGEKLSKFQIGAIFLAIIGISHEIWRVGSIAWETLCVAIGYSVYFVLRKKLQTDHLGGFWWELLLMSPVALYFILNSKTLTIMALQPSLWLVVMGLGVLSAIGLGSYLLASRLLPLVLFGLLSYLEPVLLALVSLFLGESIQPDEWLSYVPIWCAVGLLVIEGSMYLYRQKQKRISLQRKTATLESLKQQHGTDENHG